MHILEVVKVEEKLIWHYQCFIPGISWHTSLTSIFVLIEIVNCSHLRLACIHTDTQIKTHVHKSTLQVHTYTCVQHTYTYLYGHVHAHTDTDTHIHVHTDRQRHWHTKHTPKDTPKDTPTHKPRMFSCRLKPSKPFRSHANITYTTLCMYSINLFGDEI